MTFPLLKTIQFQPRLDMCVSTCLKIICDNQFSQIRISIKQFNLWCKYEGKFGGGVPLDKLREYLTPKLTDMKIDYNEKENINIDFLYKLREEGIYPLVVFHLRDYNKWKKNTKIEVFSDDEPNYHVLIVVDIDKEKQTLKVFDPLYDKYRKRKQEEPDNEGNYDEISYQNFYNYWTKEELIYPVIWLIKKEKQKVNKEQKTLS